jgi:hypothetical protein
VGVVPAAAPEGWAAPEAAGAALAGEEGSAAEEGGGWAPEEVTVGWAVPGAAPVGRVAQAGGEEAPVGWVERAGNHSSSPLGREERARATVAAEEMEALKV